MRQAHRPIRFVGMETERDCDVATLDLRGSNDGQTQILIISCFSSNARLLTEQQSGLPAKSNETRREGGFDKSTPLGIEVGLSRAEVTRSNRGLGSQSDNVFVTRAYHWGQ